MAELAVELSTPRGVLRGIRHAPSAHARPAVLLGGWFSSTHIGAARLYVQLGRVLARHDIALWRVDPYGVGNSDGDFKDTTFDSELEDYARVIEESGARVLIGHSVGCTLALHLAKPGDEVWCIAPSFGRAPASLIPEHLRAEMLASGGAERKSTMLRADFLLRLEQPVPDKPCVALRGTDEEHFPRDTITHAVPSARIVDVDKGDHNFLARGGRDALWREIAALAARL